MGLFKYFISLLIFCSVVLSIIESGALKPRTIIVELSISHFNSLSLYFMYFGALLLGTNSTFNSDA